jgi:hypothetical protein
MNLHVVEEMGTTLKAQQLLPVSFSILAATAEWVVPVLILQTHVQLTTSSLKSASSDLVCARMVSINVPFCGGG